MEEKILQKLIRTDRELIDSIAEEGVELKFNKTDNGFGLFRFIKTGIIYLLLLTAAVSINYKIIEALDSSEEKPAMPSLVIMNAEYDGSVNRALERLFENEKNS